MATNTKSLGNGTIRRVCTSLGSVPAGNEVLGSLGQLGAFVLNADATIKSSSGDIVAIADSGGAAGTYRVLFPNVNPDIQTINWFHVSGFTPRNPTDAETCAALVTGFNKDATTKQWYITVQIVLLSSYAVTDTPPANFVVGVRAAFKYSSTSNPQ